MLTGSVPPSTGSAAAGICTYIYLHARARNLQQPSSPLSQLGCNLKAEANGLLLQRAASASSIKFATRSNPCDEIGAAACSPTVNLRIFRTVIFCNAQGEIFKFRLPPCQNLLFHLSKN
jgi:hypothetical protein